MKTVKIILACLVGLIIGGAAVYFVGPMLKNDKTDIAPNTMVSLQDNDLETLSSLFDASGLYQYRITDKVHAMRFYKVNFKNGKRTTSEPIFTPSAFDDGVKEVKGKISWGMIRAENGLTVLSIGSIDQLQSVHNFQFKRPDSGAIKLNLSFINSTIDSKIIPGKENILAAWLYQPGTQEYEQKKSADELVKAVQDSKYPYAYALTVVFK
jgi:hypothetical protein